MEARARFEAAWGIELPPERGWHLSQMFDGMERGEFNTLYVLGENPAQSEADSKRALGAARGPRLHDRPGHPHDQDVRDGRRGLPVVGVVVRVRRRDGDQLRAPRAAHAQGDRPARRGARRPVDHLRARASGSATTGASRRPSRSWDELRSLSPMHGGMSYARLRGRGRHPVAVPDTRTIPGSRVPARAAVGRARRGPARAVLGHAVGAADRRARRRLPDPPDHRPAAGLLQHRRAVGPLQLAAAPRRDARPVARRTPSGSASSPARSCGSPRAAARSRRRCGSIPACGRGSRS